MAPSPAGRRPAHPGRPAHPARLAALIALPFALLAGLLAYRWLDAGTRPAQPGRTSSASAEPTAAVPMDATPLPSRAATLCRALVARLPTALRSLPARPVSAGIGQNAAYGDPPITLACAARPAPVVPGTATVYPLSGVCWYAEEQPDATSWTALGREVPVRVTVPRQYDQPGQWVIEFSAPVAATVPAAPGAPPGCG